MTAIAAPVLGATRAVFNAADVMPQEKTDRRVSDEGRFPLISQEGMPAMTGVFGVTVPLRHPMNPMPEQAAQITHSFFEAALIGVRVGARPEQQRVAAVVAGIFVMAIALPRQGVLMTHQ